MIKESKSTKDEVLKKKKKKKNSELLNSHQVFALWERSMVNDKDWYIRSFLISKRRFPLSVPWEK